MMVEVHLPYHRTRLVSEAGPLGLSEDIFNFASHDLVWRAECDINSDWRSKRWHVPEALGTRRPVDEDDVLRDLEYSVINVEVVLVDNRTKKKAFLYRKNRSSFVVEHPEDDEDDNYVLIDDEGRKLVLTDRELSFHFSPRLQLIEVGGEEDIDMLRWDPQEAGKWKIKFCLQIKTTTAVDEGDFYRLFKSCLEWV